jgi:hypothetical protein
MARTLPIDTILDALRERGADAADEHEGEVPALCETPDLEEEWSAIHLPQPWTTDLLDDAQRRLIEEAWMVGYEMRREELNRRRGFVAS